MKNTGAFVDWRHPEKFATKLHSYEWAKNSFKEDKPDPAW